MPKICNVGEDEYSGWDGDRHLNIAPGEEVEVSAAKVEQLKSDFPGWFKVKAAGAAAKEKAAAEKAAAEKVAAKEKAAAEKAAAKEKAAAEKAAAKEKAAAEKAAAAAAPSP